MSVELKPSGQLGFARPFTQSVTQSLSIHNPNSRPVAVKLKTTSPKSYCVRPNSGRIEAGETLSVSVILQPMQEDPPINAKSKDKFLIMSCVIPVEREGAGLTELWAEKEQNGKTDVHEQKIRCVYLAASETIDEGPSGVEAGDSTFAGDQTLHDAVASPSQAHAELQNVSTSLGNPPTRAVDIAPVPAGAPSSAAASSAPIGSSSYSTSDSTIPSASIPSNPIQAASASVQSAIPKSQITTLGQSVVQTVEEQLKIAQQEIASLQSKISESEKAGLEATGLRKRTTGSGAGGAGQDVGILSDKMIEQVTSPAGVSVQVVIAVAVAVAVITYVFF